MQTNYVGAAIVLVAAVLMAGCATASSSEQKQKPAAVETIEGTGLKRLTLTEHAVERLGIQVTAVVGNVVPYSAVLYDLTGGTFLYTRTGPSVYVRAPIVVDHVEKDQAFLIEGPSAGTLVVTVGGVELYGVETGLGQ